MALPHIPSKDVAAVAQFAALPYRRHRSSELEIMLITSRGSRQWIIPNGKPIEGLTAPETAAQEAYEEAGLIGEVGATEIGQFRIRGLRLSV